MKIVPVLVVMLRVELFRVLVFCVWKVQYILCFFCEGTWWNILFRGNVCLTWWADLVFPTENVGLLDCIGSSEL